MTETKQNLNYLALCAFVLVGLMIMGLGNATAASAELYSVRGISVDESAGSASEARVIAVAKGQQRAYQVLLRKLTPKSYHSDLPQLTDSAITALVTGFQVSNEKTSSQRYLADLTYDFKRDRIIPLLEAHSLPYSESVSNALLVLPIFEHEGTKILWDEPNPWRDAWIEVFEGEEGPVGSQKRKDDWAQAKILPLIVPTGTLADMKTTSVSDAINLNEEALRDLADMYDAGSVLVAYASVRNQGGVRRLDISYQRSDFASPAVVESFTGGDSDREIFRAAIFDVVQNLQESWKDQNILDHSVLNRLAVSTPIKGLTEWLTIQQKLRSIPAVKEMQVRELTIERAFWEFSFVGKLEQLSVALEQRDLILQNMDGYWSIESKVKR
ncbi:MAG: DUF2066 domain-containing protein [Sneathiella sp.]